jgi:hypothetical protein
MPRLHAGLCGGDHTPVRAATEGRRYFFKYTIDRHTLRVSVCCMDEYRLRRGMLRKLSMTLRP